MEHKFRKWKSIKIPEEQFNYIRQVAFHENAKKQDITEHLISLGIKVKEAQK